MTGRMLPFGLAFGFVLSRAGATEYDAIHGMFLLTDLHLVGVIGTAVALCALGFAVIRRWSLRTPGGQPITLVEKPMTPTLLAGALLFGIGWALSGTCPGTALAQIGEGKLAALATFAGILLGAAQRPDARSSQGHS